MPVWLMPATYFDAHLNPAGKAVLMVVLFDLVCRAATE
jgi:hypothetical protein